MIHTTKCNWKTRVGLILACLWILTVGGTLAFGMTCDINNDNRVDAVDVQLIINAALGLIGLQEQVPSTGVGAAQVQEVINSALGAPVGESDVVASETDYVVVDTGQTYCFSDYTWITPPASGERFYGQDAQYSGAQPAYHDNRDGTITDLNTGLMWQADPGAKMTWAKAKAAAASFDLAGYTDWRLPSIKELYSLINFNGVTAMGAANSIPYIDTRYFYFVYGDESIGERFIDAQYCSSTGYVWTTMGGNETVFGVNFADGRIKGYPAADPRGYEKTFFVMYVRGNENYGLNDFEDNGDGTITDHATGLMWTKDDSGDGMTWEDALAWVLQKNDEAFLGHTDWRLPNAKELQSIVDYTRSPATADSAAIDPVFNATPILDEGGLVNFPFYWTGTTHMDGPSPGFQAVYVAFGEALGFMSFPFNPGAPELLDVHGAGAQRSDPKMGDPADYPYGRGPQGDVIRIYNYVRCVRGGNVTPAAAETQLPDNTEPPPPPSGGNNPGDQLPPPPGGERPPTFEELDVSGDGKLSIVEAASIPHMTQELFQELDANGDGYLSREELPPPPRDGEGPDGQLPPPPDGEGAPDGQLPSPPDGQRPSTFEELDIDGDGALSLNEARSIPGMTATLFVELDVDEDDYLSREELPPPPTGGGMPPGRF